LVLARVTIAKKSSLTTVQRRTVAIRESRLASEAATTRKRGRGVTIAEDGLVVDDEDVGKINVL
jgi:hypothetical protein